MAEYWSGSDSKGYRIKIIVDEVSVDIPNNRSNVRIQLWLYSGLTSFNGYNVRTKIRVHNNIDENTQPRGIGQNGQQKLMDRTWTVPHNPDGSSRIYVLGEIQGSGGYSPGNIIIDRHIDLTKIPRKSTFAIPTSYEIGKHYVLKASAPDRMFVHGYYLTLGALNNIHLGNASDTFDWTIPDTYLSELKDAPSRRGVLTVVTTYGGTVIDRQSRDITISIPGDSAPTFPEETSLIIQNDSKFKTLTDYFYIGLTTYDIQPSDDAVGKYGSSIVKYELAIPSIGYTNVSERKRFRDVLLSSDSTYNVTMVAIDSRGLRSEPITGSIEQRPYVYPVISLSAQRTGSSNDQIVVTRTGKVSSILGSDGQERNELIIAIYYKEVGSEAWTHSKTDTYLRMTELINSPIVLPETFSPTKSYNIKMSVRDITGNSVESLATVGPETVLVSYNKDKVGIGKIAEYGQLDVSGEIYTNSHIVHSKLTPMNSDGSNRHVNFDDVKSSYNWSDEILTSIPLPGGTTKHVNAIKRKTVPTSNEGTTFGWSDDYAYNPLLVNKPGQQVQNPMLYFHTNKDGRDVLTYFHGENPIWTDLLEKGPGVTSVVVKKEGNIVSLKYNIKKTTNDTNVGKIHRSLLPTDIPRMSLPCTPWSLDRNHLAFMLFYMDNGGDEWVQIGLHGYRNDIVYSGVVTWTL